jgi:hypothetical protein
MSTPEMPADRIAELVGSEELLKLGPFIRDELSYTRTIWVTPEVLDVVNSTDEENWIAIRHREFEASLDAFINWEEISVSEDPFVKDRETFLARVCSHCSGAMGHTYYRATARHAVPWRICRPG